VSDRRYLDIFMEPLRVCRSYRPKFGIGSEEETTLVDFRRLYGGDPLYHWVGFDSDLMYAAHKAAGGITSVYRQLGIGCERLLRQIMQDVGSLSDDDVSWSFQIEKEDGSVGTLKLDARLLTEHIRDAKMKRRVEHWLRQCTDKLSIATTPTRTLHGAVFEIRQGYKSADSKRQNADLRFALRAYGENLLPVMMLASSQVNSAVRRRYHSSNLLVLIGSLSEDSTASTFAFYRDVVGYDLAGFFDRHCRVIREEVQAILLSLLSAQAS
jgi:hypothetical protein